MPSLSDSDRDHLRNILKQYHLEHIYEQLEKVSESAIFISPTEPDEYQKTGNTRLGGAPDLPPEIAWVQEDGKYLSFIAQINLGELPVLVDSPLPNQGILYFFAGYFDHPMKRKVILYEGDLSRLTQATQPPSESFMDDPDYAIYNPYQVAIKQGISVPDYGSHLFKKLDLEYGNIVDGKMEYDRYFEVIDILTGFPTPGNHRVSKLMGLHSTIGDDNDEQVYRFNVPPFENEVSINPDDWQLLFEVASHVRTTGMCWCDAGILQFMIQKADLQALNFDRPCAWIITS